MNYNILFCTLCIFISSCCYVHIATTEEKIAFEHDQAEKIFYVAGDFGSPGSGLRRVTTGIANDISQNKFTSAPCVLSVGDNLYLKGFARKNKDISPVNRIFRIGKLLAKCVYEGQKIPVIVVPGNHDYDGEALAKEREWGDISIWYFLQKLKNGNGKKLFSNWQIYPGRRNFEYKSASALYDYLYSSNANLVDFMKPIRVAPEITSDSIAVIAIDSELLIDLFHQGKEKLARLYLRYLRQTATTQKAKWKVLIAHHPIETYAKHRPGKLGSFLFGPGWPQFPYMWHKIVALPPLGTLATLGWWGIHYRQDIHSSPYESYRSAVYEIMKETDIQLFIAGHDHCSQIIDLDKAFSDAPNNITQLVSGEAAKTDPVTSGKGTLFYHTGGNGFAKILVFFDKLVIQMKSGKGQHLYQHTIHKKIK